LEEQAHGWFTNTSKSSEVSRRGQEEEGRGAGPSTSTGCLWVPRRRCSARLGCASFMPGGRRSRVGFGFVALMDSITDYGPLVKEIYSLFPP
jgi:hypothetical protein